MNIQIKNSDEASLIAKTARDKNEPSSCQSGLKQSVVNRKNFDTLVRTS